LITENHGILCSSIKVIIKYDFFYRAEGTNSVIVYPNPLPSGSQLNIEGVPKNSRIYVYNQVGVQVYSTVATDNTVKLNLQVPDGIYLLRIGDNGIKIVVTK